MVYMLAINHVTLSTAMVFGASLYLDQPFFLPFIAFVVFATLLPDIDHGGSEVSKFFPFIHHALPHRGPTHSIVGVAIFGFGLQFLLGYSTILSVILLVASLIGVYYLEKLLEKRTVQIASKTKGFFSHKQVKLILKLTSAILVIFILSLMFLIWKERFRQEIVLLLTAGFAGHLLGDFITKDGIPLLWPIKIRMGLKLFRTGSWVEGFIGAILLAVNALLIYKFWNQFDLSNLAYWHGYLSNFWG
jgi:membrane-bound metal-dependent hydrolase YbcI (DUF457 family)